MVVPGIHRDIPGMIHPNPDDRIHEIAARQHGVVTRAQLLDAGLSRGTIDHRVKKGALRPVHRGVYRTGPITARYQPEMAAVLACGPDAALCDRTAAGIWGMMQHRQREAPVDVAGPRTLRGPGSGVRLHRRGPIEADEVTRRHGIPLTTVARTVLDLASSLNPYELERVLARALKRDLVALDAVEAMLHRHPRRPGCHNLRTLLADTAGPALTRSELEERFLKLLRRAGVPPPLANTLVAGLEVDFFWPDRHVVVEVDGFAFHGRRNAFENDHQRDTLLAADNFTVLRFTWRQIEDEPQKVVAQLCLVLGARSPRRSERG